MEWRCGTFRFVFPRPALVMGIINVTPDSFSDGGRFLDPAAAVAQGQRLVSEGADLLDIGGESTRPGAKPVDTAEELRRVIPVIEELAAKVCIPLSIDTQKPSVARAALRAGASVVNDIAAARDDSKMWEVVAQAGAGYVAMHMQGSPATMQTGPVYADVGADIRAFFAERLVRLTSAGLNLEQVVLDPGIGFGKSLAHNLDLLAHIAAFGSLGRPVLLGVSRKSFLSRFTADPESAPADRLPGGLACTVWAALQGAQIFRTHDVAATVQALRVTEALANRNQTTA